MVTGYICRHGETRWNHQDIIQGWKDSPLTKKGIQHAKQIAGTLIDQDIKTIISSDLGRAKETAEIINRRLHLKISFDNTLRELCHGKYDGKSNKLLTMESPKYKSFSYKFPKGESAEMLTRRLAHFMKNLETKYGQDNFLIVAHQGIIKAMMILDNKLDRYLFYSLKIPFDLIGKVTVKDGKITSFEFTPIGSLS